MNFHLLPDPEKRNDKILEKLKKPYFLAIFGQKWIFSILQNKVFDFTITYQQANNQWKQMSSYREKLLSDRQIDRQMVDNLIGPFL